MERHGRIRWGDIATNLCGQPSCAKLQGYWLFEDCGNRKTTDSCANPEHRPHCPYPDMICAMAGSTRPPTACF